MGQKVSNSGRRGEREKSLGWGGGGPCSEFWGQVA